MAQETIFGINAVAARLRKGGALVSLILRDGLSSRRIEELVSLARHQQCRVERQPEEWFDAATSLVHQGVALVIQVGALPSESALDAMLEGNRTDLLFLVLDGVTDPRNLGACLRSAATLGVNAVIVPKDNSAPLNDAAIKTASGGADSVPLIAVTNLARCLERLKRGNVWIVGTLLEAETSIDAIDLRGNIALVLGSEDKGLRRNTVQHCDYLARIPMVVGEFGFNVSVATGICLYEVQRQRRVGNS